MAKGSGGPAVVAGAVGVVALAVIWWIWGRADVVAPTTDPAPAALLANPEAAPEAGTPEAAPEAATTEPAAPEAAATSEPVAPAPEPVVPPAPEPPRFDVVRVDAGGLATVAGTAAPGGAVSVRLDGAEVARLDVGASGQFASVLSLPPSDLARMLSLVLVLPDGTEVAGAEGVAIAPVAAPDTPAPSGDTVAEATPEAAPDPAALLVSPDGVTVLQSGEASPALPLSIDSIAYGTEGEVLLGGRATPGATLRVYLDAQPVADVTADGEGRWKTQLSAEAGVLHLLRADEIDAAGKVLSRFETPFKRDLPVAETATAPVAEAPVTAAADPAAPAPAASTDPAPEPAPAPISITVQPGFTLWAIARENFGDGMMYVQVFEANRDKIKDPDLIYPGQVFTVPRP